MALLKCSQSEGNIASRGRLSASCFCTRVSGIFFILLFPVFYVYHYAVASGFVPRFLAGWFAPVSVVAAMIFGPCLVLDLRNLRLKNRFAIFSDLAFLSLIAITGSVAIVQYLFAVDDAGMALAFREYVILAVTWIALFGIGRWFPTKELYTWSKMFFYIMVVIAWVHVDLARLAFDAHTMLPISDGVASYQGFARSFVLTAMVVLVLESRLRAQVGIVMVSVSTLFILSARSELVGFILVCVVWLGLVFLRNGLNAMMIATGFSILLAVAIIWIFPSVEFNRQVLLRDIASDTSWQARQMLFMEGWDSILQNPLLGDFGGHIKSRGVGSYIHNILSTWRQFGLLGFLAFVALSLGSLVAVGRAVQARRYPLSGLVPLAFYLNLFSFFLSITTKSVFWGVPALAWGLTSRLYNKPIP